jgi:hypothetical protein
MSYKTVQFLIGRLLTDEELRLQFLRAPMDTLIGLREEGFELTRSEIEALVQTDATVWTFAAERLHPHLQRSSFRNE